MFDVEETKDAVEELPKAAPKVESKFKDIFEVNETDLLDLFESHHKNLNNLDVDDNLEHGLFEELKEPLAYNVSSDEEEEHLLTEKLLDFAIDNQVFSEPQQPLSAAPSSSSLFDVRYGSVPFGLPCIAQTRRTLDITLRNKQIEMINDKLCKVMRQPGEYVKQ